MRAWQVRETGEPNRVLQLVDTPQPEPSWGTVVVRVRAAAVNFADVLLCQGRYQVRPPLPFTPGVELCGDVVAVGEGVTDRRVGERVIGLAALPRGGLAEYTVMEAATVFPAPDSLDDEEAAVFFIGYQTGWFGLHHRATIQPGDVLLVHAAAGGVGSAAVQLGRAAGATVIGVVGNERKVEVARAMGAHVVVNRAREDLVDVVKDVTGGHGANVVYDPVGGDSYQRSTKCVAFEGRIVVVGFAGGTIPQPALNHALLKNYSIVGLHWGLYARRDREAVAQAHSQLTRLANEGIARPRVGERLPLSEAAAGLQRLAEGNTVGRLAVSPGLG
ncbi:NADPH:quinone oxidoreductase family protein [Actinoalloteichus sp. AHMU CJ021]|uniref:NADPH2:quinone reductase n=1 Tax=Actinoalloteichus caeruleus DSM 43889 TaxID=1120930 RepID=A0ABT1JEX3_ACTCY|nr:NADPH:quinone oxidoreductase family protein [Actinoalloteichus caeruleus]AUS77217.1 NADPH:quinone oxidoreductase family protein [Actinoalloteichus sp. AHMU CJ021]MCP2331026.1 NADPH2:quinone reductase [Actinoalloteichus caeruleus DSM 43889]